MHKKRENFDIVRENLIRFLAISAIPAIVATVTTYNLVEQNTRSIEVIVRDIRAMERRIVEVEKQAAISEALNNAKDKH